MKGKESKDDCLGKVLVFDLGGGTFDVSILDLTNEVSQVPIFPFPWNYCIIDIQLFESYSVKLMK